MALPDLFIDELQNFSGPLSEVKLIVDELYNRYGDNAMVRLDAPEGDIEFIIERKEYN